MDTTTTWLRAVIAGALSVGTLGCAERTIGGGDEVAEGETEETGTTMDTGIEPEPFECPGTNVTIEYDLMPDGTCAPCVDASCFDKAWAQAIDDGYWCDGSCDCDVSLTCSATVPNEDGQCLHGFYVEEWCGEGRPLLAEGEARVAPTERRADWLMDPAQLPRLSVPLAVREEVRDAWLRRAAMEHASVAAFARFGLQLQALGAPAALIRAVQASGLDELRHARACYAIASQLADDGAGFGPGLLDLTGLEVDATPDRVAVESILEGCIGETIAAAKMRYLSSSAASPALRELLATIAADEARHAALAWQALSWMLARFDLDATVRETFAEALASVEPKGPGASSLEAHGVLDEQTSAWITATCMREVVAPALRALLGDRRTSQRRASSIV